MISTSILHVYKRKDSVQYMKSSTFDLGLLVLITVDGLEKTLTHGKQKGRFTLDQESMGAINQITRLYFLTYDIHYCFYMLLPAIRKRVSRPKLKSLLRLWRFYS